MGLLKQLFRAAAAWFEYRITRWAYDRRVAEKVAEREARDEATHKANEMDAALAAPGTTGVLDVESLLRGLRRRPKIHRGNGTPN